METRPGGLQDKIRTEALEAAEFDIQLILEKLTTIFQAPF